MEVNKKQKVNILNYQAEHPPKMLIGQRVAPDDERIYWFRVTAARMNAHYQAQPNYVCNLNNT